MATKANRTFVYTLAAIALAVLTVMSFLGMITIVASVIIALLITAMALAIFCVNGVSGQLCLQRRTDDAENFSAIQRITGGVAHEFNNLLQVVVGYSELIQDENPLDENLQKYIAQICQAGKRGGRIVNRLLAFSGQQSLNPTLINIDNYLHKMLAPLRCFLGGKMNIEYSSSLSDNCVMADSSLFEQLLIHLCSNAAAAMGGSGVVAIETRNCCVDSKYISHEPQAHVGHYAVLDIIDSGPGIETDKLNMIFEPFYSTAPACIEKGMGLSAAYGIARSFGGWIEVDTACGGPSRFSVFIPVSGQCCDAFTGDSTNYGIENTAHGSGKAPRALVCQDDPFTARIICSALESIGCDTYIASSGKHAAAMLDHQGDSFDMLVIDPVLPGVGAGVISRRSRQIRSDIAVIMVSSLDAELSTDGPEQSRIFSVLGLIEIVQKYLK